MKNLIDGVLLNDIQLVEECLKKGDDPNIKYKGTPILSWACAGYHFEIAKILIDFGADVNARERDGATALIDSSMLGPSSYIKLLLDAGADANLADEEGNTALMMAAKGGKLESVKLIYQAGADINVQNEDGVTALMWTVIWRDFPDVVEFLLKNGANPLLRRKYDNKDVLEAAREDNREASIKILERYIKEKE